MESIKINDGSIKLCVNDDETRVISFNPNDVNFAQRFYELLDDFNNKEQEMLGKAKALDDTLKYDAQGKPINMGEIFKFTKELDEYFREQLDYVFGEGTSKTCFGNINVMSVDNKGNRILNNFLIAIAPYISKARQNKVNTYTNKYKGKNGNANKK